MCFSWPVHRLGPFNHVGLTLPVVNICISVYMRVTVSYPCKWLQGWLLDMVNLFGACGGFRILHERIVHGENLTVPLIAALIKWGLTYLHLICVLSLYQTDPCLCTRLTLVSIPEMFLCWFSVLVAGIVTYLDANRTVQVRRRYACPYTTVFKSIYVVDYGNTAVLIESVGKTVGSLILQVFVPSF